MVQKVVDKSEIVKLRDGEVVLYLRPESMRWQARFKLPDNQWHRITTKRTNIDEAMRIATDAYDRARYRHMEGVNAVSRRFRDVAELTIKLLDAETENGKGKVIYKDYKQVIRTYLIPFFGNRQIDKITHDNIVQFDSWRESEMARKPSASTLMNHNAALNRVFDTAVIQGWMVKKNVPELKNHGKKGKRRPDFTIDEWRRVVRNMPHWIKKAPDERSRQMRELLQDYVLVLSNTGIRTGREAENIKWKHIRWHTDNDGERYLVISVNGKTGERDLVARHGCDVFFQRIQSRFPELAKMSFDALLKAKIDKFVFRLPDRKTKKGKIIESTQTKNLYHTFNQFLTEYNLLEDKQGNHRTLYSLRHMYATMRLQIDNVSHFKLKEQMGTSVQMLEKHYAHMTPIMSAKELAGKKYEQKPKKSDNKTSTEQKSTETKMK